MPIIPWIEQNISLADDISSELDKPDFTRYPYQIEILKQWEDLSCRKHVIVMCCEQLGKTSLAVYGILYRLTYKPGSILCCYPSDNKAAEINQAKFIPLLSRLPGIKEELQRPRTIRSDRIKMSNAVMYWQGSGSKIISKSCDCVFLDEIDQWSTENPQNVRDGWKRTRSFNSCMEIAVCSPTTQTGQIYQEFMKGSQGYYTLRCQKCRELTLRSCDIHHLQWESTYNEALKTYIVKKGTERLICPKCGFEHTEDMKRMMILEGEYVHVVPELKKERPSYQIGCLASQLKSMSWSEIANAALESRKDFRYLNPAELRQLLERTSIQASSYNERRDN